MITNWKKSFCNLLFFLVVLDCGKLDLNNAGDPKSSSFFETILFRFLTDPLLSSDKCKTFNRWEKSLGSGTAKTAVHSFVKVSNEDLIVTGFTNENLGPGKNVNFTGTSGTTVNGFIMRLDANTGNQIWLDYLGEIDGDIGPKVVKFSNGELLFTFIALTEIPSPLSAKVNGFAFGLARFDENGNRRWHTYFDSLDLVPSNNVSIDSNDLVHVAVKLNGTNGHLPFAEFPTPSNTANGSTDTDILYAVVNSTGTPKSQIYISSTTGDAPLAMVRIGTNLFIAGTTSGNMNGFSGHPSLTLERVFVLRSDENQTISWINYYGPTSAATTGSLTELKTDNKSLFFIGRTSDGFGNPISPYQGTSIKNYYFQKIETSGANSWLTFLGNSSVTISEGYRIPIFASPNSQNVYSTLVGPNTNNRFTGLGAAETGNGTDILQRVTVKLAVNSGAYDKVMFETNDTAPQKTIYTMLDEVCTGKMFRGERVLPDVGDNTRESFKIKIFPTSELP